MHVKIKLNNGRRACMKIPIQPQTQRALRPHHWPGTGKIWSPSHAWCSIPLAVFVPLVGVPLVVVPLVVVPLVVVPLVVVPLVVVPLSFLFENITLLCYHYHFSEQEWCTGVFLCFVLRSLSISLKMQVSSKGEIDFWTFSFLLHSTAQFS